MKATVVIDGGVATKSSDQNPPPPSESWIPPPGMLLLVISIEKETARGSMKLPNDLAATTAALICVCEFLKTEWLNRVEI